jgi:hypothetical protein
MVWTKKTTSRYFPFKAYGRGRGSGRIQALFRIADPHPFSADLDPLFNAESCRGILLFTLMRILIQTLLLGVADLVGSKRVFRIVDPHPFSADLDPLLNADPCVGILLFTLMRIWIQILLLGVADLVGCKPFSGLRIRVTLMRIWIRSLMRIWIRSLMLIRVA